METLKMAKPKNVVWDYDKGADVLYISFGKPKKALSMDIGGGLLARYDNMHKLVGFTIMGLSDVLKRRSLTSKSMRSAGS